MFDIATQATAAGALAWLLNEAPDAAEIERTLQVTRPLDPARYAFWRKEARELVDMKLSLPTLTAAGQRRSRATLRDRVDVLLHHEDVRSTPRHSTAQLVAAFFLDDEGQMRLSNTRFETAAMWYAVALAEWIGPACAFDIRRCARAGCPRYFLLNIATRNTPGKPPQYCSEAHRLSSTERGRKHRQKTGG